VGTINFTNTYHYLLDGRHWRGVRTKDYSYARWLDGKVELLDLKNDRLQMHNPADNDGAVRVTLDFGDHLPPAPDAYGAGGFADGYGDAAGAAGDGGCGAVAGSEPLGPRPCGGRLKSWNFAGFWG